MSEAPAETATGATGGATDAAAAPIQNALAAPAAAPGALGFIPGEKSEKGAASGPISEEERGAAILKQMEYYFSDANLPRDKFLRGEMAKDDEWVELKVIATFNRMKVLVPSLDLATIVDAIRNSANLEVCEEKMRVRRAASRRGKKEATLGGKTYTSRDELLTHARGLLAKDATLDEAATAFLKDLLGYHATPSEKIGCGVASFKAGCNPKFPETRCFVIVRTDGTEIDFSYIKCIDKIFPKDDRPAWARRTGKRKADSPIDYVHAKKKGPAASSGDADADADADGADGADEPAYSKGLIVLLKQARGTCPTPLCQPPAASASADFACRAGARRPDNRHAARDLRRGRRERQVCRAGA